MEKCEQMPKRFSRAAIAAVLLLAGCEDAPKAAAKATSAGGKIPVAAVSASASASASAPILASASIKVEKPPKEEVKVSAAPSIDLSAIPAWDRSKLRPNTPEVAEEIRKNIHSNFGEELPWRCDYKDETEDIPTCDAARIAEEHRKNSKVLKLRPGMEAKMEDFLETYETNLERYVRVSKLAHLPPSLIAAFHRREGGANFDTYLHNGQALGKVTTLTPRGILFEEGQWEEAAIHALGGNIVDANGRKSETYKRNRRVQLGLDEKSNDMGLMMAMAEFYNGLGHRYKGFRNCYVYGGSNIECQGNMSLGLSHDLTHPRLGVAVMLQAALKADEKRKTSEKRF